MESNPPPIVFFDGVCGLCNRFVDFLLTQDTQGQFRFAPLQGTTATTLLKDHPEANKLSTILLKDENGIHTRSDAVLKILHRLKGLWVLTYPLRYLPKSLRDWLYDGVAQNRYRWFGKKETCRIPTPEERARFLD